jgi:hypothetical protein
VELKSATAQKYHWYQALVLDPKLGWAEEAQFLYELLFSRWPSAHHMMSAL